MYADDSFFTLSVAGQVGLALLSLILVGGVVWIVWCIARGRGTVMRLVMAVLVYGGFVWLSPQVYYGYYLLIFRGLPVQWVIGWPPFAEMAQMSVFAGRATLSAHGQGLLFWALMTAAAAARGPRP